MAGRGFFKDVEPIKNHRIKIMRNGLWNSLFWPVNPDRESSGVNLAESFADAYSKEYDVDVGLIPCADGGTCLDQWAVGNILFDNAISQARLAQRTSKIVGILWHQGESDTAPELYPYYKEKFLTIIMSMCKELSLENIPIITGGLGDFLSDFAKVYPQYSYYNNYIHINKTLEEISEENKHFGFASAKGLTSNEDLLHFNSLSLREFGIRYYNEFKKIISLKKDNLLYETIEYSTERAEIEKL